MNECGKGHTAASIELSAIDSASNMEGDDFCLQEVVARGNIRGNLDVHSSAAAIQVVRSPIVAVSRALVCGRP